MAEYILKRLGKDGDTVEKLCQECQDLDGRENYISPVSILEDIGWIKLGHSGTYMNTAKGETEVQQN